MAAALCGSELRGTSKTNTPQRFSWRGTTQLWQKPNQTREQTHGGDATQSNVSWPLALSAGASLLSGMIWETGAAFRIEWSSDGTSLEQTPDRLRCFRTHWRGMGKRDRRSSTLYGSTGAPSSHRPEPDAVSAGSSEGLPSHILEGWQRGRLTGANERHFCYRVSLWFKIIHCYNPDETGNHHCLRLDREGIILHQQRESEQRKKLLKSKLRGLSGSWPICHK